MQNAVIMCTVFILLQYFCTRIAHLIEILENRLFGYYAGIMLNALLTYYARNYAGIIGASLSMCVLCCVVCVVCSVVVCCM